MSAGEGKDAAIDDEVNEAKMADEGIGGYDPDMNEEGEDDFEDLIGGIDDLPIFANEENRNLDGQVKQKESKLETVKKELVENKERFEIMGEHLKNVRQELLHTQQLTDSKKREIDTEQHLCSLAQREGGRIVVEVKKFQDEALDIQDKLNAVQNNIFKGNEKMDRFKLQMNWNQEELEQWALAAKQKEEDNLALQKYTRADDVKTKELTLQIEKLTQQTADKKAELDDEVTETQAKQIELDKTAEEFRQLHRERQELVRQWKESIDNMQRRDEDIARAGENFAKAKEELEAKRAVLKQNEQRLKRQDDDNVEAQSKIDVRVRVVSQQREQLEQSRARLTSLKDEVEVVRSELVSAAADLMSKRSENANHGKVLEEKKARLEAARKSYQTTKKRLEGEMGNTDNVEAAAKQSEQRLKDNETALTDARKAVDVKKKEMFRASQELFQRRQQEANYIAEISGAQSAAKNLGQKIHRLDQESLRQQELIYNAEFQIQQMERKVARASGIRSDDEKKELTAKIEKLTLRLDEEKQRETFLEQQIKKLGDELRASKTKAQECTAEVERLESRVAEIELTNGAASQTLRKTNKEAEESMVKHDVMKLELKRLRDTLNGKADEVFSLENRKFQLKMSMEERKKEIALHREVQRAQLKGAEEERHKTALELQDRVSRVERLQSKYEVLVKRGGFQEEGEDKSQAYFVIQAAQRKEELQREGDELDAKIRKSEREIRALESTLKHLTVRNQQYRASFHKADMSSQEAKESKLLEERVKSTSDQLFKKKKELQRMQSEWEEDNRRLAQLKEQTEQLRVHVDHLGSAGQQVESEVEQQKSKFESTYRRVQQLAAVQRAEAGVADNEETAAEKDLRAQVVKDISRNVLFTLDQLGKEYPEMAEGLQREVHRHGLRLPARPAAQA